MNNFVKLKEWTKEEIHEQIINGEIDHDFICEYISKRDRVYNKLIDRVNELESVIKEIREYINKKLTDVNLRYGVDNEFRQEYDDLLQILDKGVQ